MRPRLIAAAGVVAALAAIAGCSSSTGPGSAKQLAVADLRLQVGTKGTVQPFKVVLGYAVPGPSMALAFMLTPDTLVFPPAKVGAKATLLPGTASFDSAAARLTNGVDDVMLRDMELANGLSGGVLQYESKLLQIDRTLDPGTGVDLAGCTIQRIVTQVDSVSVGVDAIGDSTVLVVAALRVFGQPPKP